MTLLQILSLQEGSERQLLQKVSRDPALDSFLTPSLGDGMSLSNESTALSTISSLAVKDHRLARAQRGLLVPGASLGPELTF